MDYIKLSPENLESEHICCAISNNNDIQVASKKSWLAKRFDDGLVFLKGNVRGKLFIEYIPAEKAWIPVDAPDYMYISCFWIAGQYKGNGYADDLLNECISDAKKQGKKGLCILSSQKKKMPFLADPKFLAYKGFSVADNAEPYFELYYLPFADDEKKPCFCDCVKNPCVEEDGFVIYYSDWCPYTAKYVPLLAQTASENNVKLKTVHIDSTEMARVSPSPFTAFSLFYNQQFVTHEILSQPKFKKIVDSLTIK